MRKCGGTMDAKGQSILEVVVVLPFLFTFVGLLYKFNMGIQIAINNLQYSRSQLYILTANSPEYPRLQFRHFAPNIFKETDQELMILGVADPSAINGADIDPIPQINRISRVGGIKGSDQSGEVSKRTDVRIRDTTGICTQMNGVSPKVPYSADGVRGLKSQAWPFKKLVCQYSGKWIGDGNE